MQNPTLGEVLGLTPYAVTERIIVVRAERKEAFVLWLTSFYQPKYARQYAERGGHSDPISRKIEAERKAASMPLITNRPLNSEDLPSFLKGTIDLKRHDLVQQAEVAAAYEEFVGNYEARELYRNGLKAAKRDLLKQGLKGDQLDAALAKRRTELKAEVGFVRVMPDLPPKPAHKAKVPKRDILAEKLAAFDAACGK